LKVLIKEKTLNWIKKIAMLAKTRKQNIIKKIENLDGNALQKLEEVLEQILSESSSEKILREHAIQSEEDIKNGNVMDMTEAEKRLMDKFGI
jgi:hypothetical protein